MITPKIEFYKQFGKGTDPWYAKAERWAKKQRFPISFLLLGFIDYLKKWWIDVKIYNTMKDVDRQTDELLQSWKEPEREPHIVETGVFGDEGWSIEYQIQLLKEGPHQLAQAWLLQAMHNDYKKMKGIKEPPSRESGYQTTLKEFFKTYE